MRLTFTTQNSMKNHNFKITLSYDGTKYNGWQNQKNTSNTIQEKLETLLSKMTGEKIEVIGSGRTDAGVHALAQTANFHTDSEMSEQEILTYMNTYLPQDIAVSRVQQVNGRFHSRLNAKEKIYEYRILNSKIPNVFEHKYQYQIPQKLDVEKMREGAKHLAGTHDFQAFCSTKKSKKSTERILYSVGIQENGSEIRIVFRGNGFLYNMVRIMTGTLIEIGLGKREPESILELFETKERSQAGFKAPASGLFLVSVGYELDN